MTIGRIPGSLTVLLLLALAIPVAAQEPSAAKEAKETKAKKATEETKILKEFGYTVIEAQDGEGDVAVSGVCGRLKHGVALLELEGEGAVGQGTPGQDLCGVQAQVDVILAGCRVDIGEVEDVKRCAA